MMESGYSIVRSADDFVILCRSKDEAVFALEQVRAWTGESGLSLYSKKTHFGNCLVKGQGFDFFGYRFESGRRFVRKKSLKYFMDKIRSKMKRARSGSLRIMIGEPNPILNGWFTYFKHAIKGIFKDIDGFMQRCLRASLRRRMRKPGHGNSYADHRCYPNSSFAKLGLFTTSEALCLVRQAR